MDSLKEQKRNDHQQLLNYRKGIQEAEMQFVFTEEGIWETDWEISEKNELSISECGQRLMVQSMGLIWWDST